MAIYDFARTKLNNDLSWANEDERKRLLGALETAIQGVEKFSLRSDRLERRQPLARFSAADEPVVDGIEVCAVCRRRTAGGLVGRPSLQDWALPCLRKPRCRPAQAHPSKQSPAATKDMSQPSFPIPTDFGLNKGSLRELDTLPEQSSR